MLIYYRRGSLGARRYTLKREPLSEPSRRRRVNEGARLAGPYQEVQPPLYKHIFWHRVARSAARHGVK